MGPLYRSARRCPTLILPLVLFLVFSPPVPAQDGSASLQGTVEDASGARVALAGVSVITPGNGFRRETVTESDGSFALDMLPSGEYIVNATAPGMAIVARTYVQLFVGGTTRTRLHLAVVGSTENLTVKETSAPVDVQASDVSHVVGQDEIGQLPLNGRRFTDLALLTTGVTQDPRGLTSNSNGDLSFGGVRGFQNNFTVDGTDNNNSFFAQARGRYRAPYQFSNEVVKEFQVASNSYTSELGRAGGAVFNVVTKSGSNDWHGSTFYYLRDRQFDAAPAYAGGKPQDRQQQYGGTASGPIRKDRVFFYAGFDQHLLTLPSIVRFGSNQDSIIPQPADYEASDYPLVFAAARQLNAMGGSYPTNMSGNAIFGKVDFVPSSKHLAFVRVNTSRYSGTNNVFFDPSSPITGYAESANGTENVATETIAGSLTSAWSPRLTSNLRAQYSHDLQESYANSDQPLTKIYNLVAGFGESSILPRSTNERKLQIADTFSYVKGRLDWKFGGDFIQAWTDNYFPSMFGGEYYFGTVKVNPWNFDPMVYGLKLTPLRAFAHGVPRYYMQDFGHAVSHPGSRSYAAFVQSTYRATRYLTFNLGVRYDLQTFEVGDLIGNPFYAPSGKVPTDYNNFAPRFGFAYGVGRHRPLMIRGGFGLFYTQVPTMYASQVAMNNGMSQSRLRLDMMKPAQAALMTSYPNPLVNCPRGTLVCVPPASLAPYLTTTVSAFAPDFQTPYTEHASLTVQRELPGKVVASASYQYVRGVNLVRSLDANLPKPKVTDYPVYNDDGSVFLNTYYQVASFSTWQTTRSVTCPYPPCINSVQRPDPRLGTINSFESIASSAYSGLAISLKRQSSNGLFFLLGYTYAKATDDGPDALVVGRPGNVQNVYATALEKGPSVDDQRHRLVASAVLSPNPMQLGHNFLDALMNHWKFSGILTVGSGRPVNATIAGDANQDDNSYNDRLPRFRRNAFTGPDYMTTDMRITRDIKMGEHARLELVAESFNLFNRTNQRVDLSDDGFYNSAGQFVVYSTKVAGRQYPGQFQLNSKFLLPTNAYAPRQLQFAVRLNY